MSKDDEWRLDEAARCYRSPAYFIGGYCHIYDPVAREWIPFSLWREQTETLETIHLNRLTIILKARQLGLTWLVLGYFLWLMLFRPAATILLFSRRDTEAIYLLDERLKGMHGRLPEWMQKGSTLRVTKDNAHEWALSNHSVAYAFPTTAGDSYTATAALVDEADLVPDLDTLLSSVKPTIDAGGRLILLSRADKSKPQSTFKTIYRAAKAGQNEWTPVFLPWHVRPSRDAAWHEAQKRDSLANHGSLDYLHEQYPAKDAEALAARTLDKRIAPQWLLQCYVEQEPLSDGELREAGFPAIPGLLIYRLPEPGRKYVAGLDPAEGNPTSDDSATTVIDALTGEEVARLRGKFEPSILATHSDAVGVLYNRAGLMVERNNHGHTVLLALERDGECPVLAGLDGRAGWISSRLGKTLLYNATAEAYRDGERILHSFDTYTQLGSIEGNTLRAPAGMLDDLADSDALATVARTAKPVGKPKREVWVGR